MKRIRNYSISGSKYFILGVIFLVTVIITFISMKFEQIMPSATTMADATLPTVAMDTEAGTQYNVLHGYTSELDSTLFYGNITPVAKDRKLTVTINTYGEDIEGVAYKIRSLEDKSLIENTEVSDYDNAGSSINVTFNIKNLLDTGKEYALEIVLKTKKHEAVYYYTRIVYGVDYDLQKKLDFVMDFNACTFDDSRLKDISGYVLKSAVIKCTCIEIHDKIKLFLKVIIHSINNSCVIIYCLMLLCLKHNLKRILFPGIKKILYVKCNIYTAACIIIITNLSILNKRLIL